MNNSGLCIILTIVQKFRIQKVQYCISERVQAGDLIIFIAQILRCRSPTTQNGPAGWQSISR